MAGPSIPIVTNRQGFKLIKQLFKTSTCKKRCVDIKVMPTRAELEEMLDGLEDLAEFIEKLKKLTNGKPKRAKRHRK